MPREQVDRSAFAHSGKRDFELDCPAESLELRGDQRRQPCVAFIEQPIEAGTANNRNVQPRTERQNGPLQLCQRHALQVASLDAGDLGATDARLRRDIDLAPLEAMAESTMKPANLARIHLRIVMERA